MQETTQDLVMRLRRIREQRQLSVAMIVDMVEANGDHISPVTIQRVMTEDRNFRYYDTLKPIAKVLLRLEEQEEGISDEEQATKDVALIKDMEHQILVEKCKKYEERVKYLEERVEYLKGQVEIQQVANARKDEQIAARDASIKKRDEMLSKVIDMLNQSRKEE